MPATPRSELLANLWVFRKRYATVPHGKIYGVLGLTKEMDETYRIDGLTNYAVCQLHCNVYVPIQRAQARATIRH